MEVGSTLLTVLLLNYYNNWATRQNKLITKLYLTCRGGIVSLAVLKEQLWTIKCLTLNLLHLHPPAGTWRETGEGVWGWKYVSHWFFTPCPLVWLPQDMLSTGGRVIVLITLDICNFFFSLSFFLSFEVVSIHLHGRCLLGGFGKWHSPPMHMNAMIF